MILCEDSFRVVWLKMVEYRVVVIGIVVRLENILVVVF